VFYPVAGPFKAGSKTYSHFKSKKSAKSAWKVFFQVLREDYVLIAGFLLLIQLNDDEIIMSYVFDESSPEFDQGDPDGLLVVVNTMQSSDLGHRFVKSLVDTKYGHFKNRKYIEVSSYEDFLSQVEAIAATHGPITRLDLVGHGNEGAIYFGSQNMTAFDFAKTRMLEGVFAKDAQVRMSTCFSGRGKNGDELLNSMAIRLLDEGGTMYAATTAYYPTDQAPFMLGLGNSSRNVFRFVAKGPAALDVLLERHLGISHFGLSSYSGQPKTERTEPKVKRRDYEPRAKWLKNALEPAWLLPRTLRAIDQTLPNAK
ncbi:MAG TPA: DUF4347 domain-containing protein, partial [Oligoflexia bacterium]|nr:DUF4347 domain-containing protein [Oligoflexia bacterium]